MTDPEPYDEPDSPIPIDGHRCQHITEIKWAKKVMRSGTVITRQVIYSVALVVLGSLATIGISVGASCRAAGATEARVNGLEKSLSTLTDTVKAASDLSSQQYQKIFELGIRNDAKLQQQTTAMKQFQETTQQLVDAIGVDRRRKAP